jgi:hypothetical protein
MENIRNNFDLSPPNLASLRSFDVAQDMLCGRNIWIVVPH